MPKATAKPPSRARVGYTPQQVAKRIYWLLFALANPDEIECRIDTGDLDLNYFEPSRTGRTDRASDRFVRFKLKPDELKSRFQA